MILEIIKLALQGPIEWIAVILLITGPIYALSSIIRININLTIDKTDVINEDITSVQDIKSCINDNASDDNKIGFN